jgi:2-amino-4-hydroxy-6-hydroxymethyldihydropteridine diphosphokinase
VTAQPRFLNVAVKGTSRLEPHALLGFVKSIEKRLGRVEGGSRWGPRPIDIDIILYGDRVVSDPDLVIPHVSMPVRRFCLVPVAEIAAGFPVPPEGTPVSVLLERCQDTHEVNPI